MTSRAVHLFFSYLSLANNAFSGSIPATLASVVGLLYVTRKFMRAGVIVGMTGHM